MDPNKTLADIRAAHAAWLNGTVDYDALLDNIAALDDWLSRGGFLPSAWQPLTPNQPTN